MQQQRRCWWHIMLKITKRGEKKKAYFELSCIKNNWMKVKWVPIRTLSFSCLRILCPPWN
jgi:hypothetical protein